MHSAEHPTEPARSLLWTALLGVLGAGLIAGGARAAFPAEPVPITLQTVAVLVAGGVWGARVGCLAVVLYVGAAAAGLGVLSGGAHLDLGALGESKSLGYLVGFLPAAWIASCAVRERRGAAGSGARGTRSLHAVARALAATFAAHAVILALGWAWLARLVGAAPALEHGVVPYLPGALVKSVVAGAVILSARRR